MRVRSLLEVLFVIEYLILHPEEVERHRATGVKSMWEAFQKFKKHVFDPNRFGFNVPESVDL